MKKIRLAIVDDHTLVRDGLARVLASEPDLAVIAACSDGAGARRLLQDDHPDILLLDIGLPDGDGLGLIDEISRLSPKTRVLMLSMHSEPEYAAEALARGAHGLIAKSASVELLVDAIRRVAAGETIPAEKELSPRERQILRLIADGRSNGEVASVLGLQLKTVDGHCQRLMRKLRTHTRAGLVAYGRRTRL